MIQFGILILSLISMFLYMFDQAKKTAQKEGQRDNKLSKILEEMTGLKRDMKNHNHQIYESQFMEWESRYQLREQHIEGVVQNLGLKLGDQTEFLTEMRAVIKPIAKIETTLEYMSKMLNEQMTDLKKRVDYIEDKIYK